MTCPQRAERLWLVISIALFWLILTGVAALDLPQWQSFPQPKAQFSKLSAPVLGWIQWLSSLLNHFEPTSGYLNPYPWTPLPDP
ncbi:MAG: hypothetical protein AAFV93_07530 [Chloroflexota bacterium]